MSRNCPGCGRFHPAKDVCSNGTHRFLTSPAGHGHTIHGQQPRVKQQVSRDTRRPSGRGR